MKVISILPQEKPPLFRVLCPEQ